MKTEGKFTLVIGGSTELTNKVPISSWHGFEYLFQRLLTGQEVADGAIDYYGVKVELGPAALLSAAADYLDDGFHDKLVADLREIAECGELEEWRPPSSS